MKNIFVNTQPVVINTETSDLRNWRLLGMEMEALGTRLDAAREALAKSRTAWSRWYWQETLDRLMLQWRALVPLHDGDARMTVIPRWHTDYEWWEGTQEPVYTGLDGLTDRLFDKIFRSEDLDDAWERHRNERIMKCNCQ